jgi:hypothetical protein
MVTLSFRIGKVHHIILRCEAVAEPRRRGRQLLRIRASLEGEEVLQRSLRQGDLTQNTRANTRADQQIRIEFDMETVSEEFGTY